MHADSNLSETGAEIPIFIMRPFRGQLEQATHTVVDRLRTEGDKNLFWLDTSGWLNTEIDFDGWPEDQDFFLDGCPPASSTTAEANSIIQKRARRGNGV